MVQRVEQGGDRPEYAQRESISDYDFVLAEKINEIFEPFPPLGLAGSGKGQ